MRSDDRLFRRIALACAMLCLCLAPASGCIPAATPPPEPVTIAFAHLYADRRHFEELIPIFNESYPHITVELKSVRYILQFQSFKPSEANIETRIVIGDKPSSPQIEPATSN